MIKKQPTQQPQEVAELEKTLAELTQVETNKEALEGEVETARAKKLREVNPKLKPVDKAEKSLKSQAIKFVKENRKNKKIFGKGKQSIHTRAGTVGFKNGRPSVKIPRRMTEVELIALAKHAGVAEHCVVSSERFHKTMFRQALKAGLIPESFAKSVGIKITRREHYYVRTKTAKRSRPTSAKAKSRKAVPHK
jgi:phage host-nuclease inhibitor protein Gam